MMNLWKTIISIILFGCLPALPAGDLSQIIKAGKLRVAVTDTSMPPFITCNEKHEYHGFELDLMSSCATSMGVKLELVPVDSYDGLVTALVEDKADIALSQLSRTLPRILRVDFTQPYVKQHFALLINRQKILQMRGNETLDNYLHHYEGPLVVQNVACHIEPVKTLFPKAKLIFVEKRSEIEQLLKKRELIAYFGDQIGVCALMQSFTGSHLFYQRVILEDTTDNVCIALQPNCPRLLFYLNCFLEEHINQINCILQDVL